MQHSFDIEIAKKYGILEAILINNLLFWITKNKANNKNFHDGDYWTYNSTKAFAELFPYVSKRQIEKALQHLRDEDIIKVGNYNEMKYDRTLWYAFTEKGKCISSFGEMETPQNVNGNPDEVKPIPNIKPVCKKDSKTNNKDVIPQLIIDYCMKYEDKALGGDISDLLFAWLEVRKAKRAVNTEKAIQLNLSKLDKLAQQSNMSVKEYLEQVIARSWSAFFVINNYNGNKPQEQKPAQKLKGAIEL